MGGGGRSGQALLLHFSLNLGNGFWGHDHMRSQSLTTWGLSVPQEGTIILHPILNTFPGWYPHKIFNVSGLPASVLLSIVYVCFFTAWLCSFTALNLLALWSERKTLKTQHFKFEISISPFSKRLILRTWGVPDVKTFLTDYDHQGP